VSVINADDRSCTELAAIKTPWRINYSTKKSFAKPKDNHECGLWIESASAEIGRVSGRMLSNTDDDVETLVIPMSGIFNLQNALCAIACAHAVNVPLRDAVKALSTCTGIPGRMERIEAGQPFAVYVDFTVTPQSYEATLSTLTSSVKPGGRLLVLTGSCGDRMKEKRPIVGKIVSTYADIMVVANEDPYTEDPEKIIDDVWAGIDHVKTQAHRIFDRREAIRFLLREARPNDIVILCGKGSDTTMWVKSGQIPWNEREVTIEELRSLTTQG
jgi:UDP-N-acetylmuramoyl-L-alanyl-D-glutamate--2,6-diaminopimelate ligase